MKYWSQRHPVVGGIAIPGSDVGCMQLYREMKTIPMVRGSLKIRRARLWWLTIN